MLEGMAGGPCPQCLKPAQKVGSACYCSACGWNLQRACAHLEANVAQKRMLAVGLLSVSSIVLPFAIFGHLWREWGVLAGLFSLVLLVHIRERVQLTKLRNNSKNVLWPTDRIETEHGVNEQPKWHAILSLPLPRRIQLSVRGKRRIVTAVFVQVLLISLMFSLASFAWAEARRKGYLAEFSLWKFQAVCLSPNLIVLFAAAWSDYRRGVRARRLLEHGEIAIARIEDRLDTARDRVEYVFHDAAGREQRGSEKISSGKVSKNMLLPVIYERHDLSRKYIYVPEDFFEVLSESGCGIRIEKPRAKDGSTPG